MSNPRKPATARARWTTIAACIGLFLVGGLNVINSVELSRLSEQNPGDTLDAQVQVLATHIAGLAEQVEQSRKPSDAVPLKRYDAERQNVEQRLTAIEQALNERQGSNNLQPLRDRLARMEQRWTEQRQAQKTKPAVPRPTPAKLKIA